MKTYHMFFVFVKGHMTLWLKRDNSTILPFYNRNNLKINHKTPNYNLKPSSLSPIDQGPLRSCDQMVCRYGARCRINGAFAECHCSKECPTNTPPITVCGTDGNTYGSECQLSLFSCRMQRPITVAYQGPCQGKFLFYYFTTLRK